MRLQLTLLVLLSSFTLAAEVIVWESNNSSMEVNESNATEVYTMGSVIKIHYNYDEAMTLAKNENKNLFILGERVHWPWCKKLKNTTLQDEALTMQLNEEYVVLILDRDKTITYPEKYKVIGVPVVYLVDTNEKVHVIEQGYNENPESYMELLNICTKRTESE